MATEQFVVTAIYHIKKERKEKETNGKELIKNVTFASLLSQCPK